MQQEILEPNPEAAVRVYAIWFDMLVADNRGKWRPEFMTDSRVTHLWDEKRLAGCWYADHERPRGVFGPVVWDAYYLYGPDATWNDAPEPLIGSGYTIYAKRKTLAQEIAPLLGETPSTPDRSVRFVGTSLTDLRCPF